MQEKDSRYVFQSNDDNTIADQTKHIATVSADYIRIVTTRWKAAELEHVDEMSEAENSLITEDESIENIWLNIANNNRDHVQQNDPNIEWVTKALRTGSRPTHSNVISLNPTIRHYWSIW